MGNPSATWIQDPVRRLGRIPLGILGNMGRMGMFLGQALFYTFAPPLKVFLVLKQIRFIGFSRKEPSGWLTMSSSRA